MHRTISLSRLFSIFATLLVIMLTANLTFIVLPNTERLAQSERNKEAVVRYSAIFQAANAISAERGPSNVLMSIEPGQDPEAARRLGEFRERTDFALDAIQGNATRGGSIDGSHLEQIRRTLVQGRMLIDRTVDLPQTGRTLKMRADAIETMIAQQKSQILRSDPALFGSLKMVHKASDLRERGGSANLHSVLSGLSA